MEISSRREKVCASIDKAFLVTHPADLFYLTGFSGSTGFFLLLEDGEAVLLCDGRYITQAREEVDEQVEVLSFDNNPLQAVAQFLRRRSVRECMVEETLAVKSYHSLRENGISPQAVRSPVGDLRMVKERVEILCIEEALAIAENAFQRVRWLMQPGTRERDIALELDYCIRAQGAEVAFPTIVASGVRSALPHARPSSRTLCDGDPVVIDWGTQYKGYCSDTTRTVMVGKHTDQRLSKVISIVRDTHCIVQDMAKAGVSCVEMDTTARDHLDKYGWGKYFTHGLGHGVGLAVHEEPRIGPKAALPLQEGMVITVEPGVYLPGVGGVRLENMLVVGRERSRVLNRLPILV